MPVARTRKSAATWQARIAELATKREVHAGFEWFHKYERQLRDWQMEVTAIPAPPKAHGSGGNSFIQRGNQTPVAHHP